MEQGEKDKKVKDENLKYNKQKQKIEEYEKGMDEGTEEAKELERESRAEKKTVSFYYYCAFPLD